MDRFHFCADVVFHWVFPREMTLDQAELKDSFEKTRLEGAGAARHPMATTTPEAPVNWARCQTFVPAPCA